MEAVIFVGVQAAGKTTFYNGRFVATHTHINLDTLKTRAREDDLLMNCIANGRSFVVDNTNSTVAQRAKYIALSHQQQYRVIGYYFSISAHEAIRRNAARPSPQRVPDKAIWGTRAKLELPSFSEGFDELHYVHIHAGGYDVEPWRDAL
jgi:predicted kinase